MVRFQLSLYITKAHRLLGSTSIGVLFDPIVASIEAVRDMIGAISMESYKILQL